MKLASQSRNRARASAKPLIGRGKRQGNNSERNVTRNHEKNRFGKRVRRSLKRGAWREGRAPDLASYFWKCGGFHPVFTGADMCVVEVGRGGVYLWGRGGLMASVKTRFSVTCFTKGEENEACRATTIVVTLTCSKKDKTFTPGSQLTLSDCTKQNAQQNAQQKQSDGYTRRKKEQKTTKQNV